eukprot:1161331-Pelagomonas_calceolata.AAC.2
MTPSVMPTKTDHIQQAPQKCLKHRTQTRGVCTQDPHGTGGGGCGGGCGDRVPMGGLPKLSKGSTGWALREAEDLCPSLLRGRGGALPSSEASLSLSVLSSVGMDMLFK